MEDSRVGASGVLALVMLLFLEMAALIHLDHQLPSRCFWRGSGRGWPALGDRSVRLSAAGGFRCFLHRGHGRPLLDAVLHRGCSLLAWLSDPLSVLAVYLSPFCVPSDLDGLVATRVTQRSRTGDDQGFTLLVLSPMPAATST